MANALDKKGRVSIMQFSVHKTFIIRGRDIAITALSLSSSGMRWVLRPDCPTYILLSIFFLSEQVNGTRMPAWKLETISK